MPTLDQLISSARAAVTTATNHVDDATATIDRVRNACLADGGRNPTNAESVAVRDAIAARDRATAEHTAATDHLNMLLSEQRDDQEAVHMSTIRPPGAPRPHYDTVVRTGAEPRTYGPGSGRSFLADAWNATTRGDSLAGEYLDRSQREARAAYEERAIATSGMAGLIIPQYLVEQSAVALRNGRPLCNAIKRLPLPDQGMSFIVPRGTTGASAAAQATENTAVSLTDEVWTNLTVPVCTVAGQSPVSRQALERGGEAVDAMITTDLTGAYAAAVDTYVINGSGGSGQPLGILNTAGIGAAVAYGAPITWALFNSKVAGQVTGVAAQGAGITAKALVMAPRR